MQLCIVELITSRNSLIYSLPGAKTHAGSWPTQSLSMLSRKVLQSAVASGTSNSQQGGPVIKHVPTPSTRGPPRLKRRQRTSAAEWARKWPGILTKVATSTSLLGSFTCCKFTTWDRRLYFSSEGRRAEDFFARKIRRL